MVYLAILTVTGIRSLLRVKTIDSGLWPCLNSGLSQSDWVTLEMYAAFLNLNFLFWKRLGWLHRRKLWGEIKQYRSAVRHWVPDKHFGSVCCAYYHYFASFLCRQILPEGKHNAWKFRFVWKPDKGDFCVRQRLSSLAWWTPSLWYQLLGVLSWRWQVQGCLEPGHCRRLRLHAFQK